MPELDADELTRASPSRSSPSPSRRRRPGARPSSRRPRARPLPGDLQGRLEALGLPGHLLGDDLRRRRRSVRAPMPRSPGRWVCRLPAAPGCRAVPARCCSSSAPGFETLRAARSLAASLRLDPDSVQWATRGELAGLAPKGSRMTTVETAMDRRQDAAASGTVTIVAVDAPLRTDAYWMSQMLADLVADRGVGRRRGHPQARGPRALDRRAPPGRRARRAPTPTSAPTLPPSCARWPPPWRSLDGVRATPHRWASLLCERLENTKA